jgi:putative GTP pyrophosphokinase
MEVSPSIETILEQYDQEFEIYSAFCRKVSGLIEEILRENDLHVHSVTYRVKDRESLAKKLTRDESHYSSLESLTDISGIRITTYLEDDVDKVAGFIEKEFVIDHENSVDKRALLDPDRFGYLSTHHVVSLSPERCRLVEYRRFPRLKTEIQTRSILQHAWAEIEHDLGYKSTQEVPHDIRRRFSRLAGLLELADQEFISIRNELSSYEESVPKKIEVTPQLVAIDKASLIAFVANSERVKTLDQKIGSFCGARIRFDEEAIARNVNRMRFLGLQTIGELEEALRVQSAAIIGFAKAWLAGSTYPALMSSISLFYLAYVLVACTSDPTKVSDYLKTFNMERPDDDLTERIIATYEERTTVVG